VNAAAQRIAVWTAYRRTSANAPIIYYGRVIDDDLGEVSRCHHQHTAQDEAQACAEKQLSNAAASGPENA
jgi:hypothetical protein